MCRRPPRRARGAARDAAPTGGPQRPQAGLGDRLRGRVPGLSRPPSTPPHDAAGLAADLRRAISGEVRFDAGSRALYATDSSNYRQLPWGVVFPRTTGEVVAAIEVCRRHGAPLLPRGAGTSLAGQGTNRAVVLDLSRHLDRVLDIDPERRTARVEPGVVLDTLRRRAAEHGLTFGPDPATHATCTLGGMLGNNSCGAHSVTAGKTDDNVHTLDVLTYDGLRLTAGATPDDELEARVRRGGREGEIYRRLRELRDRYAPLIRERFPPIPRRVSGFNLDQLLPEKGFHVARALVGTEGTCVTLLGATLRLVPAPPARALLVLAFDDACAAADPVPEILAAGPFGLEGFDDHLVADRNNRNRGRGEDAEVLPPGRGWLLVEMGAETLAEAAGRARQLAARLASVPHLTGSRLLETAAEQARAWEIREAGVGRTARPPGGRPTWPGWEDSAVPPARLGAYLRDLRRLLDRFGYGDAAFYGHYGQGCLHARIPFDLESREGVARFRRFVEEAADLVVAYGGSLSGEHGDGQARGELLERMYGPELVAAFREFKAIWDPDNRMNPGKVVDPAPLDRDLRLAAASDRRRPPPPPTAFAYTDDGGSLERAVLRCVGVGRCRRDEGGVMCPSWRVTHDERHSTRGRARLLFEMLRGEAITGGFRSPEVKEALDLCLACKGCKRDCPVGVDMATYKAEFLSHHYRGRLRPRAAYALGLAPWWARAGARAPRLANGLLGIPAVAALARAAGGLTRERPLPRLARRSFRRWFAARPAAAPAGGGERVLLWPDTFTDLFHPEIGEAAVAVLEAAGFRVVLPRAVLCCGRPLYDFGMLRLARRQLSRIVEALAAEIEAGTPLVGLEPSCLATFRDELPEMLPGDPRARRLAASSLTLGELLERRAPEFPWPRLEGRRAIFHGHCHHESVMGTGAERRLLGERLGLALEIPETSCCGMAGAFGFERDKYELSVACGERALLPAVRRAPPETLLVADGFSCRTQIEHLAGRRPLHLAEVLRRALEGGGRG